MGRPKLPQPAELEETRARFQAWRQTRKNGDALPKELWSEAAGLARRLGINRVSEALGLNHTTLKDHAAKGRVATGPVQQPQPEPIRPAFVELSIDPGARMRAPADGNPFQDSLPAGPALEVARPGGERMVLRWPAGSVVDACGLVAAFLAMSPSQCQGRWTGGRGR
jgi:hypothetical protein